MICLIDNYDSFTFNLVHYLGELGAEVEVHRNDKVTCAAVVAGLKQAHVHVGFQNLAFGLGANPTADVLAMKAAHVDFLISCMEGSDNLAVIQSMRQNGMTNFHAIWLNGYLNGARGNTLIDPLSVTENNLIDYCLSHNNMLVLDAARNVVGVAK